MILLFVIALVVIALVVIALVVIALVVIGRAMRVVRVATIDLNNNP